MLSDRDSFRTDINSKGSSVVKYVSSLWLICLRLALYLHTLSYKLSTICAIKAFGVHPKHGIINYAEWFSSQLRRDDVVLDIGSKTGQMVQLMAESASFVTGVEIERKSHDQAEMNNKRDNIMFLCADATKYDFSKHRPITVITLSNVLEHIENRQLFLLSLLTRANWRDNIGRVLVRVPAIDREWLVPVKQKLGLSWKLDSTHFVEYTEMSLESELKNAQLNVKRISTRFGEIFAVCEFHKNPEYPKTIYR